MLSFLFPRLTASQRRGQPLFDSAVAEARQPHWYVEGGVEDTVDGRFAVIATACALLTVRLEQLAQGAEAKSAALAERFIEAMDAEHRQMGINDPALGKMVRKMLGSLAVRVGAWRDAIVGTREWDSVVQSSLYGGAEASPEQKAHSYERLRDYWKRLRASSDAELIEGKF